MTSEVQTLEKRIQAAKKFLNTEMVNCKIAADEAKYSLQEIGYHMDTIHEIERVGIRNLSELESVKLNRVLNSVEDTMKLCLSDN